MTRRRGGVPALTAGIALSVAACAAPRGQLDRPRAASGRPMAGPAFAVCPAAGSPAVSGHTSTLGTLTLPCLRPGPRVELARLGGDRPVLLNLWASWCVPCQREMPRLQQAAGRTAGRVQFLGVDTLDSPAAARSFLAAVRVTYPQLLDADGGARARLGAVGLPVTLVLAADGQVAYRRLGELHPADLAAALRAAGVPVPTAEPGAR